jgi:DNA-binding beta-propeller fold protein YncE
MSNRILRSTCVLVAAASLSLVTLDGQPAQPVVLVAASGGQEILFHDASSLARLTSVKVGRGPHEIAISADGRRAFVADAGSPKEPGATISVIDVNARKVTKTLSLPAGCSPHDLRVSRDGTRLWSTCARARRVAEIDVERGTATKTWETGKEGGWMLIVTPDERKIYVANLEGRSLSTIDRQTDRVTTLELDGGAMGMDVSPDGRQLWVGAVDAERVWIVDVATDRVTATIEKAFKATGRIRFLPGGARVLVQHESGKLSLVNAATRTVESTLALVDGAKCLAVSRDGRRVFVGHPDANRVTVVDLQTMKPVGGFDAGPAPDGIVLAAP